MRLSLRQLVFPVLVVLACLTFPRGHRTNAAADPLRVVLLVDSSAAAENMISEFRAGMNALIDALPDDAEVAIASTGRQLRVRIQPTIDRAALHKTARAFATDGGANAFLESLLEADGRFLQRSVYRQQRIVILSTDNGESRDELRVDAYNTFMRDFQRRKGAAHAVVVGKGHGVVSELARNLTGNTSGHFESLLLPRLVPERLQTIGRRLAEPE